MQNKIAIRRATQILIVIRSMGTASYIALGGRDSQDRRLVGVGDALPIDTPLGKRYLDLTTLFCSSDTADAVIEVIGDSWEGV